MKHLGSNAWPHYAIFRVLRARFCSSEATRKSYAPTEDSLYRRISRAGNPRASIAAVLDQWIDEGKEVKQDELRVFIKELRKYLRFRHALQISEWMSYQRNHVLSTSDIAVRLDLVSRVHGLEPAEKYFDSIPETMRVFQVFRKSRATMQKMKKFTLISSLSYNVMLNLYARLGKYEKLDVLTQEMEEMGISWDKVTYNIILNAHATTADVEEMEKLLMKMEADALISVNWSTYVVVANGFLKSGLKEKALTMLKRAEQRTYGISRRLAYENILTLYAACGVKDEVYRLWELYKNIGKLVNSGYLSMLSSLVKLDDIDGAERLLVEWESGTTVFDIRIPNLMIRAYCQKGLLEKAVAYLKRLTESGKELDALPLDCVATGYFINGQIVKAVETMKEAFLARRPGWKPNQNTLAACVKYMKGQGEEEGAEEILKSLKEEGYISSILAL
ncbi:hypothetical protein HS088_TW17G00589 [Tripterygium wilfordii]|uniref:Pentatricopeptide repeat-containing protein n=1 Tax=Tripterygium wilfordii TaxID=458696 RepID=A0A7J7CG77_TRIWF|nr:hypothetical protein HS088_TW17G00589 [Tripterygium wilfordii]